MKTPLLACALLLSLTACTRHSVELIKPSPPREAMVLCPPMPVKPSNPTDDDNALWEAQVIDWGVHCGVAHNVLVRWLLER